MTSFFGSPNWRSGKLQDLVLLQRGFDITKAEQKDGPIPVYSSSGANSYHDVSKVSGPGVIIGRKGTLGSVFYCDGEFWPHDTTLWSKDLRGNNARFVYYALQRIDMSLFDTGAANPTLNRNHIHDLPIFIPEREVQDRIVAILSSYDDLIDNNRRRIALLEDSARQLYKEWFVRFRFPGHEHVKTTDGVPEGWESMPFSDAVLVNPTTPWSGDGEIRSVPMAAVSENGMCCDVTAFERRTKSTSVRFVNGDTLFARITPCLENGKTAFVDFLGKDEVASGSTELVVFRERALSRYFIYLLSRENAFRECAIKSMIGSSGRQRVQPSCFDKYFVSVPPNQIKEAFDKDVRPLFDQIRLLDRQNLQLARARDLLLPKLMSGAIAV